MRLEASEHLELQLAIEHRVVARKRLQMTMMPWRSDELRMNIASQNAPGLRSVLLVRCVRRAATIEFLRAEMRVVAAAASIGRMALFWTFYPTTYAILSMSSTVALSPHIITTTWRSES